jgi:hypothetical protein
MTTTTRPQPITRPFSLRTLGILGAAAIVGIALNAAIAALAVANGAPNGYGPLTLPAYALFTIVGVAVGWVGWVAVHRRSRDPRRLLTVLVSVVALASFVPDILLLALGFIPGTVPVAVYALMLMHVVVVAVSVPAYVIAGRIPRA